VNDMASAMPAVNIGAKNLLPSLMSFVLIVFLPIVKVNLNHRPSFFYKLAIFLLCQGLK
jgi:hypothetical protein